MWSRHHTEGEELGSNTSFTAYYLCPIQQSSKPSINYCTELLGGYSQSPHATLLDEYAWYFKEQNKY